MKQCVSDQVTLKQGPVYRIQYITMTHDRYCISATDQTEADSWHGLVQHAAQFWTVETSNDFNLLRICFISLLVKKGVLYFVL